MKYNCEICDKDNEIFYLLLLDNTRKYECYECYKEKYKEDIKIFIKITDENGDIIKTNMTVLRSLGVGF